MAEVKLKNMLVNMTRRLDSLFPGYFGVDTKHNHYRDYGWPISPEFAQFYAMYDRNGIGFAAIDQIASKTYQDNPQFVIGDDVHEQTSQEKTIEDHLKKIRFWQNFADADRRGMVGRYGALILRFADGRRFQEEVGTVPGGIEGLVEVIPAWEEQLRVSQWDEDELSENYGKPTMYDFQESRVGQDDNQRNPRQFSVHPDRVIIFSRDGSIHDNSILKPGFNDLLTIEKVSGAGGEGFWKNAKSTPVLNVDEKANISKLQTLLGASSTDDLKTKIGEQVENWQKGFDKLLMLQGIEAKTLGVTLPSDPDKFFGLPLNSFAASANIPVKILIGSQTGERASVEDVKEFNKTISSRRENEIRPTINTFLEMMVDYQVMPNADWQTAWEDLTDSTPEEKTDRADKMASTNQKMVGTGEIVYTTGEIREAAGYPAELPEEAEDDFDTGDEDDLNDLEDEEGEEDGPTEER